MVVSVDRAASSPSSPVRATARLPVLDDSDSDTTSDRRLLNQAPIRRSADEEEAEWSLLLDELTLEQLGLLDGSMIEKTMALLLQTTLLLLLVG